MYKPKVEFYNHCISLFPWPTDLNMFCSNLLLNVNVPVNFEMKSVRKKKNKNINGKNIGKLQTESCLSFSIDA